MKFHEITESDYPNFPMFAWFEPALGPEDMRGVRLVYIEPTANRYEYNMARATAANDQRWIDNVNRMRDRESKLRYIIGQIDWWKSEKDFFNNERGFSNTTLVDIEDNYPNLELLPSKQAAVAAAERAGII